VFLKALGRHVGDFGKIGGQVALTEGKFCHGRNRKSEAGRKPENGKVPKMSESEATPEIVFLRETVA
ncbi:MAG: hypothetical protein WCF18_07030, partial [Chthoniobacteraceae bacterium]